MKGGEAARLREHVAALESALERKISEWEVSEGRLAAAQARREQRKTDDAGWAEARVELLTGRVESLGGQLERAEKELVAVRVELAGAVQEGARFKEQAERLGRRVMVAEADLAAGKEAERGQGGESQESGKRDEEIKAWFEEQVSL